MSNKKPILSLGSRYIWRSRWYNLRQERGRLPDGSDSTYTVVEHPGVALDDSRRGIALSRLERDALRDEPAEHVDVHEVG